MFSFGTQKNSKKNACDHYDLKSNICLVPDVEQDSPPN